MTKPEKRWQLLLVADDGRIVPFTRIKGIALALVTLLVVLGVACAGLGWRLSVEKTRFRRVHEQLTEANRQVSHYKNAHEWVAAELVLAEARMEKAGLPVSRRRPRSTDSPVADIASAEPLSEETVVGDRMEAPTVADSTGNAAAADSVAVNPSGSPPPETIPAAPVEAAPAEAAVQPETPVVALGTLTVTHDALKNRFLARFRVKNTGPRSQPVAGRCVVVLKGDGMGIGTWLAMPDVALDNGKPDGSRGQVFKISRFIDMTIEAAGRTDPAVIDTATVYVFDRSGNPLLKKDFPIDLPVLQPAAGADSPSVDQREHQAANDSGGPAKKEDRRDGRARF